MGREGSVFYLHVFVIRKSKTLPYFFGFVACTVATLIKFLLLFFWGSIWNSLIRRAQTLFSYFSILSTVELCELNLVCRILRSFYPLEKRIFWERDSWGPLTFDLDIQHMQTHIHEHLIKWKGSLMFTKFFKTKLSRCALLLTLLLFWILAKT